MSLNALPRTALYSAVDDVLTHFEVDIPAGTLTQRGSLQLQAKVQYAWPHPSGSHLYVTTSNGGPRVKSDVNHVQALAIAEDGSLSPWGPARPLPQRAVHLCLDPAGRFAINAHNFSGGSLTIHRIAADRSVGEELTHDAGAACGIYPHQAMVFPSGDGILIVDRGNNAQVARAEDPGALRILRLEGDRLTPGPVVAPGGGFGFGPRHVAFHPNGRWLYVSDERTNRLHYFRVAGTTIEPAPDCSLSTLADPEHTKSRQLAGPIHLNPEATHVYVANRADGLVSQGDTKVFAGGENNIAVYALDPQDGRPSLVQHADTQAFHARTFSIDPTGRLLVAGSIKALSVSVAPKIERVSAALSVFSIAANGHLRLLRKYDVETPGSALQYWTGIVGLR